MAARDVSEIVLTSKTAICDLLTVYHVLNFKMFGYVTKIKVKFYN